MCRYYYQQPQLRPVPRVHDAAVLRLWRLHHEVGVLFIVNIFHNISVLVYSYSVIFVFLFIFVSVLLPVSPAGAVCGCDTLTQSRLARCCEDVLGASD